MTGTLKEQLELITPALQEMRQRKEERMKQFKEVQSQIQKISAEISGKPNNDISHFDIEVNEHDLSLKRLEDYQAELQRLQKEKKDRLHKVEEYRHVLHDLATTMGMDSSEIITSIHPGLIESGGLQSKNMSDLILNRLSSTIETLKNEKEKRVNKLSNLGKLLTKLWILMDTPIEEQRIFAHLTRFISAMESDILSPGSLTIAIIEKAESEVTRLDQLKASKMKDLFLKKHRELEMICKRSHMEIPSQSQINHIMNLINTGEIDHADLLTSMDEQILKAKDEAASRKNIMEKVEKWMAACAEERWLDEYSMDHNRYSVSRDAHRNLQRAGRARIAVNKIPALVDHLITKTVTWEEERKKVFLYDGVPLLVMLEEYNSLKLEKEEEKQRQREKKRHQNQLVPERIVGSRPTTGNSHTTEKSLNGSFCSIVSFSKRVPLAEKRGSTRISTSHRLKIAGEV